MSTKLYEPIYSNLEVKLSSILLPFRLHSLSAQIQCRVPVADILYRSEFPALPLGRKKERDEQEGTLLAGLSVEFAVGATEVHSLFFISVPFSYSNLLICTTALSHSVLWTTPSTAAYRVVPTRSLFHFPVKAMCRRSHIAMFDFS